MEEGEIPYSTSKALLSKIVLKMGKAKLYVISKLIWVPILIGNRPLRMGIKVMRPPTFGNNTMVHGESRQSQSKKAILKMLGKWIS